MSEMEKIKEDVKGHEKRLTVVEMEVKTVKEAHNILTKNLSESSSIQIETSSDLKVLVSQVSAIATEMVNHAKRTNANEDNVRKDIRELRDRDYNQDLDRAKYREKGLEKKLGFWEKHWNKFIGAIITGSIAAILAKVFFVLDSFSQIPK